MKKRKLKIGRLIIVILLMIVIIMLTIFGLLKLFESNEDNYTFNKDNLNINELDYSLMQEFDFSLYSNYYMLIRLDDFKVLYGKDIDEIIYPASLTKVLTLDTCIHNIDDYNATSYITYEDYEDLINANSSLAGLKAYTDYSIKDLFYALILPSGGDSAKALENYFQNNNLDLINEMNKLVEELNLKNCHFTNSTGLHDDDLYITLNDYSKIVLDALLNNESKNVLKTFEYYLKDNTKVNSTLSLLKRNDNIIIYGGKTGFTSQAGENILVLYKANNRSYMLLLANANGNPYQGQTYHFADVNKILNYLYN